MPRVLHRTPQRPQRDYLDFPVIGRGDDRFIVTHHPDEPHDIEHAADAGCLVNLADGVAHQRQRLIAVHGVTPSAVAKSRTHRQVPGYFASSSASAQSIPECVAVPR